MSPEPTFDIAGQPYDVARVSVHMFAGSLNVEVDLRNVSVEPLEVDPRRLLLLDAQGRQLTRNAGPRGIPACGGNPRGQSIALWASDVCQLNATFYADPLAGPFRLRNRALRAITLMMEGLKWNGDPVPLRLPLEWQ